MVERAMVQGVKGKHAKTHGFESREGEILSVPSAEGVRWPQIEKLPPNECDTSH